MGYLYSSCRKESGNSQQRIRMDPATLLILSLFPGGEKETPRPSIAGPKEVV